MVTEVLANKPVTSRTSKIFDYAGWSARLPGLKEKYRDANPYPHIMLDDFIATDMINTLWNDFPRVKDAGWIHYVHVNEKKHGLNKLALLPQSIQDVIAEFSTPAFLDFVSELTGIPNLKADDTLEGGGLHQSLKGGFLNIHADFSVHPHKKNWRRRVNLLLYVNKDWQDTYGGNLELWSRDMKSCVQSIPPLFNRCVFFNTDEDSFHGVPDPLTCPEDESRKSIALYYYTEEAVTPKLHTTNYRARPKDGFKSIFIWLDKEVLGLYTRVKRRFGINDDFVSRILNFFNKK